MGIILKFTENNLFSKKVDYSQTVKALLYFSTTTSTTATKHFITQRTQTSLRRL